MMPRIVEPEWLDQLPSHDPRATASRRDLRRINSLMRHAKKASRLFFKHSTTQPWLERRLRIADLGGGDGTFLLSLAREWRARSILAEVDLLDARPAVSPQTTAAFCQLGWAIHTKTIDAHQWARPRDGDQESAQELSDIHTELTPAAQPPSYDLILCNLFLHHFKGEALSRLLARVATRTSLFIACEPRRSALSLWAARSLHLIGATAVTLHDAKVSVHAGFAGKELSQLWEQTSQPLRWHLVEGQALFSHYFIAKRQ